MNNLTVVAVLLLVVAGGGAWLFLSGGGAAGLDAAGQAILTQTAEQQAADDVDKDACRDLLKAIGKHPAKGTNSELNRCEAWLQLALGRSRRALEALEGNLTASDAAPEDQLLAAEILALRFSETGDTELGHRGATFAEDHYGSTGAKESLFRAWQLRLRMDDADRHKAHAKDLQASFAGTPEARLSKVLANYPRLKEEASGAREELTNLEKEFAEIPLELDLALALFEIESQDTVGSAVARIDRVLLAFPSSLPGKTFKAIGLLQQRKYANAKRVVESMLRRHPKHWRVQMWQALVAAAEAGLAGK